MRMPSKSLSKKEEEIRDNYLKILEVLEYNSKPLIDELTEVAEENKAYAPTIADCIVKQLENVEDHSKLPILYLIDSIIKNVGKEYMELFCKDIPRLFTQVYVQSEDEIVRTKLSKLRFTWNHVLPEVTLSSLDKMIQDVNPNWPPTPQLHVINRKDGVWNISPASLPNHGTTNGRTDTTSITLNTTQNQVQTGISSPDQRNNDTEEEKCYRFLTNLLEASKKNRNKDVEKNLRTLIQELIDSKAEPEEFCDRLKTLFNPRPQPYYLSLIGFLKKSLPLLRAAMIANELTIDGIRPPPAVATSSQTPVALPIATAPAPSAVVQAQLQDLTNKCEAMKVEAEKKDKLIDELTSNIESLRNENEIQKYMLKLYKDEVVHINTMFSKFNEMNNTMKDGLQRLKMHEENLKSTPLRETD